MSKIILKLLLKFTTYCFITIIASFFIVPLAHAITNYRITDLSVQFPGSINSGGFIPINLSDSGLVFGYETLPATQTSPAKTVYKIYNSITGKLSVPLTANGLPFAGQAMNGKGQIAGSTSVGRVIRNLNGSATPISGAIPYPNVAGPVALNDQGYLTMEGKNLQQLNMNSCTIYPYKVYVSNFSQTGFVSLPSFEEAKGIIRANDINNGRQVVGKSTTDMASQQCQGLPVISHAYVSLPAVNGKLIDLHRPAWPNHIGMGS